MSLPPLLGRGFTVERGRDTPPGPRSVPVAGLVSVACVLTGLSLIVVGVWAELGWGWGVVALGAALLAVDRWPDQKGSGG